MESQSLLSPVYSIYSKRFQSLSRWVVMCILWVIIFSIAIGKAGIANFMILMRERNVLLSTVQGLSKQNQNIREEIKNLKKYRILQERYLKQNFGYVEQKEFVFKFTKTSDLNRENL